MLLSVAQQSKMQGFYKVKVIEGSEDGGLDGAPSLPEKDTGHREGSQVSLGPACKKRVVCLERHNVLRFAHFHLADKS